MKSCKIPHTNLNVSRIAYGCNGLSYDRNHQLSSAEVTARAERLVGTACDSGITFFDHADVYGRGNSEAAFGEVLRNSPGLRNRIVIQTKCGAFIPEMPQLTDPPRVDLSYEHIVRSAEGSLRRLQTDYVDILLLHMPDALMEPEEVARAFDELQRAGKVCHFGVSNQSPVQMALLQKSLRQPLVVNQIHVGLAQAYRNDGPWRVHTHLVHDFGAELSMIFVKNVLDFRRTARSERFEGAYRYTGVPGSGTLDYCRLHDIQVQAYSPLRGDILNPPEDATPEVKQAARVLGELAERKGTVPSAVALAWLLRHPAGIVPIVGSTNPGHIVENCAADRIELSRQEWYMLLATAAGLAPI